jgi:hypothetical protein
VAGYSVSDVRLAADARRDGLDVLARAAAFRRPAGTREEPDDIDARWDLVIAGRVPRLAGVGDFEVDELAGAHRGCRRPATEASTSAAPDSVATSWPVPVAGSISSQ